MPHKFIPLLALFLLPLFSVAQKKKEPRKFDDTDRENFFRFGVKGGVNVNKIKGQSFQSGFSYNYQLGGLLQFNFSKRLGIQPEFNLVQAGGEFTDDPTDIYDDLFRDGGQKKASLTYMEVPVLLNINVGQSKHVKLQVGPAINFLLRQEVQQLVNNNSTLYKNTEFSAMGGLWIQLPLVHLGGRYKYGFTNINGIDNKETWRNQSIQVFVGLTF
jgi:hypothetical protein